MMDIAAKDARVLCLELAQAKNKNTLVHVSENLLHRR